MSTRCTVTMLDSSNSEYKTIYGHLDGYLAGVGLTLAKHYTTEDKVSALIDLGSFSSLGSSPDTTVFYSRDRNEAYELNKPVIVSSIEDIQTQEYNYLYNGMYWFFFGSDYKINLLTQEAINNEMLTSHKKTENV